MANSLHAIKNKDARSLLLFSLVGLSNTLVDYLVFFLLYHWFHNYYQGIQVISYSCGMVNSYLLNKYWTFQKKTAPGSAEIFKFITVNALALAAASAALYLAGHNSHLSMFLCKTIATGISMTVNYTGSRYWVFN
jgi:putative flippase GtrA